MQQAVRVRGPGTAQQIRQVRVALRGVGEAVPNGFPSAVLASESSGCCEVTFGFRVEHKPIPADFPKGFPIRIA